MSSKGVPAAKVRTGFTKLGTLVAPVMGIALYKENQLNVISGGVWKRWNGSSWNDIASGLSNSAKWNFTNFKGNFSDVALIASNGVDAVKVYDGTTITNLENAPTGLNFVTSHENRLYGAVKMNCITQL